MQTVPAQLCPVSSAACIAARVRVALLALLLIVALRGATPVSAHAGLLSADPNPNSVIDHSPTQITLTFDEQPQPGYTRVTIYDANQQPITSVKDPSQGANPDTLLVAVPQLKTGSYAVVWQVLSQDGHVAKGVFVFTVQLPGDPRPAEAKPSATLDASNDPPFLSIVLSAIRYGGLEALVGGLAVLLLCLLPALSVVPEAQRARAGHDLETKAQRWLFGAFGFALSAHVLILITQVAKVNNVSLLDAARYDAITAILKNTTFGAVWRVQAIVLLALGEWLVLLPATARVRLPSFRSRLGITANPSRAEPQAEAENPTTPIPRWAWGAALAAGLFLMGAQIFGGHAIDVPVHPALSMLADWTHLVASSVWFGGVVLLAGLAPALWSGTTSAVRHHATVHGIARFSNLALLAVIAFVASGTYNALQHVSAPTLTTTGYGITLIGKVALVACIIAVAAVNRYLLQPRLAGDAADMRIRRAFTLLSRLVLAEVLLGIAVIAVTGLLTQSPPAYKAAPPPPAGATASPTNANPSDVVVSIPTLMADGVRGTLSVYSQGPNVDFDALVTDDRGNLRTDVQRVTLWLRSGDRDVGLVTVPLADAGGGHYKASGAYFAVGPHWLAQLVVRRVNVAEDVNLPFALQPRPIDPTDAAGAPAFPWPRFEPAALLGLLLVALGAGVLLVTCSRRVRFGARERQAYQWGSIAILIAGVVIAAWFSAPVSR